jgi:hypothetical protein
MEFFFFEPHRFGVVLVAFMELAVAHCLVVMRLFGALFYSLVAHSRFSYNEREVAQIATGLLD